MSLSKELSIVAYYWHLRVGFSYALEALYWEIGEFDRHNTNVRCNEIINELRNRVSYRMPAEQPPSVRDRFAVYTQNLRLPREDIEHLRAAIFEVT